MLPLQSGGGVPPPRLVIGGSLYQQPWMGIGVILGQDEQVVVCGMLGSKVVVMFYMDAGVFLCLGLISSISLSCTARTSMSSIYQLNAQVLLNEILALATL